MPAFIHTKLPNNGFEFIGDSYPVPSLDPSGFDSASAQVIYRPGTGLDPLGDLYRKFPIGGTTGAAAFPDKPTGSIFYCIGPQGQPRYRFGHVWAEIGWKGLVASRTLTDFGFGASGLNVNDHVQSVALQMSSAETLWPQERDGMTVYAPSPYAPLPGYRVQGVIGPGGTLIPTAYLPYRVRIIDRAYTASIKGITVGLRKTISAPPRCPIGNPYQLDTTADIVPNTAIDLLYTYSADNKASDGWVCRNYQRTGGEYPMGDKILAFWSADYEYVKRKAI